MIDQKVKNPLTFTHEAALTFGELVSAPRTPFENLVNGDAKNKTPLLFGVEVWALQHTVL